jgi:hypothetical protein
MRTDDAADWLILSGLESLNRGNRQLVYTLPCQVANPFEPQVSLIEDDIKRGRFQEALLSSSSIPNFSTTQSHLSTCSEEQTQLLQINSVVKKFSETWGLVCDCRLQVKKKSSVESSSVVYTHTPIFLQANMADYGAQGGYGGDQFQDPA